MNSNLKVSCKWVVSERRNGLWLPKLTTYNLFTTYGRTALASAIGGSYVAPIWLSIDSFYETLNTTVNPGDTTLSLNTRVDLANDTQLVVDIDSPNKEVVTFSSVTGDTAPFTYTLTTPFQYTHDTSAKVVRQVSESDAADSINTEIQYDSINAPGQRLASASGFSPGDGQYTIQFYLTSTMGVAYFATLGLMDSATIGQGNLHNHFILGYDHSAAENDIQINGTLTIVNS